MSDVNGNNKHKTKMMQQKLSFKRVKNKILDKCFHYLFWASTIILCLVLIAIVLFIGKTGLLVFKDVSLTNFFLSTKWLPDQNKFGAAIFIIGTISLTFLTLMISVPISLFMTLFISQIMPKRFRSIPRAFLDLLVGIPSVVYGYVGVTVLIPLIRIITKETMGDGLLAAALILSVMILPTIVRLSEDAIDFLPKEYSEAAYALGSTPTQVFWNVLIPSAKNGIVTAVIMGMARAIGETMAVVMVIGNVAQLPKSLFIPTSVLTSNIVMEITNVEAGTTWSHALYMMAFVLLIISVILIVFVRLLRDRGANRI